jgi:tetratricopeptide (TPR) repeat protein
VQSKSAPVEVSGNAEKTCKYTLVSAQFANAKLQEVMQLVQQKKLAEAEATAKKLIEMMPGEASAHYVLSVAYAYQGKSAEAEPEVKKAAEILPEKFKDKVVPIQMQSLNQEAETLKAKGDNAGAIKKYEAMLTISPNDPTVYYNMAVTYGRSNNFDQAIKSIDKAIAIRPDDAESQQLKIRLQDLYLKQMDKKLEKK